MMLIITIQNFRIITNWGIKLFCQKMIYYFFLIISFITICSMASKRNKELMNYAIELLLELREVINNKTEKT